MKYHRVIKTVIGIVATLAIAICGIALTACSGNVQKTATDEQENAIIEQSSNSAAKYISDKVKEAVNEARELAAQQAIDAIGNPPQDLPDIDATSISEEDYKAWMESDAVQNATSVAEAKDAIKALAQKYEQQGQSDEAMNIGIMAEPDVTYFVE